LKAEASEQKTPITITRENEMNYSLSIAGKYLGQDQSKILELKPDGSFSIKNKSLKTGGKFKMNGLTNIIFERQNGKISQGVFKGNHLIASDGYEWKRKLNNKDVAGKYYVQSDNNDFIKLKEDGSLQGIIKSTMKVSGKYTVNKSSDITLTIKDPADEYPDHKVILEFCGNMPGRSHDILTDSSAGIEFINNFEKIETIDKYIQENSNENNYLELKVDGSFVIQMNTKVINGLYERNGDVIILLMGIDGYYIQANIENNYLLIEGNDELGRGKWHRK
jgi:hypothetical protein